VINFVDLTHPQIISQASSGGTVIRLIGNINWENGSGTGEHIELGIGIAVITEDALTGLAAPTPLDVNDDDQDWYFWATRSEHIASVGNITQTFDLPINIRTSRKLRGGYRLVAMVEKGVTVETSWNISISMRLLWKLQG